MNFIILAALLCMTTNSFADKKSVDHEGVKQVVKNNLKEIKTCYTDGLKSNPEIKGKVVLEWDIAGDGSVSKAGIKSSTLNDEAVQNCIVEKVKVLKFPIPPAGSVASVSYPFVFTNSKK